MGMHIKAVLVQCEYCLLLGLVGGFVVMDKIIYKVRGNSYLVLFTVPNLPVKGIIHLRRSPNVFLVHLHRHGVLSDFYLSMCELMLILLSISKTTACRAYKWRSAESAQADYFIHQDLHMGLVKSFIYTRQVCLKFMEDLMLCTIRLQQFRKRRCRNRPELKDQCKTAVCLIFCPVDSKGLLYMAVWFRSTAIVRTVLDEDDLLFRI